MRLSVQHTQTYTFDTPSQGVVAVARLTPRDHTGQYVCDWSVDIDADCKVQTTKDGFGNIVTSFSVTGPLESLSIQATGEIETDETLGVVKGAKEPMPTGVYLRTVGEAAEQSLAKMLCTLAGNNETPTLDYAHQLMNALHACIGSEAGQENQTQSQSDGQTTSGAGTSGQRERLSTLIRDAEDKGEVLYASVLAQAARFAGYPARIVSGYRVGADDAADTTTASSWAELHINDFGWVGFHAPSATCPDTDSVRCAIGIEKADILPLRMAQYGMASDAEASSTIKVAVMNAGQS